MRAWTRLNAPGLPELPAFCHAAVAGDTIYVSGMLGLRDDFSGVVDGGIGAETRAALAHTERILREAGATLADVVKVSAYLPDLDEWPSMNAAYQDVLGTETPARIAVGCDALLFGARVELDCIAYRPVVPD